MAAVRRKLWVGTQIAVSVVTTAKQVVDLTVSLTSQTLTDATLLRLRGRMSVRQISGGSTQRQVAMGITIVSNDALAAAPASVPGPLLDAEADWVWHDVVFVPSSSDEAAMPLNIPIDSRAMRKFRGSNKSLVLVFEGGPTNLAEATGFVRALYALP